MKKKNITILISAIVGIIILFFIVDMLRGPCLSPGELPGEYIHEHTTPEYDPESYSSRRQSIKDHIGENILIISAQTNEDFHYVTGFNENQGIAVLIPGDNKPFRMFVTPRNPADAMWYGERYGIEGAMETFKADTAYHLEEFKEILPQLIRDQDNIYLHSRDSQIASLVQETIERDGLYAEQHEADNIIHENRVIKDDWEIAQLQQTVDVTAKAHSWIMQTMAPGQKEYEVQADIEYIFQKNGLTPGFPSIVGSGPNATILHHTRNDRVMQDNELLLVDIGAKSRGGYIADITRTYPINGRFTPEQREIYELVYEANKAGIEKMKPGNKILDCHHEANSIIIDGLHEMGLLPDTTVWWQKRFYVLYRANHYIGLHVHDVGEYGFDEDYRDGHLLSSEVRGIELKPGMVLTMEPGIYLQENRLDYLHELFGDIADPEELEAFAEEVRPVYEKYAGIGVRIEDNILITESGNKELNEHMPKSPVEIEAAMKE